MAAVGFLTAAFAGRTPEAEAVFENLKRLPQEGKFVYSWCHPWQEDSPAAAEATVRLTVTPHDFAYYDVLSHRWRADAGRYELRAGPHSRLTPLRQVVELKQDIVFDE